ncbi:MAG: metallophosphoesterase family protein [Planctomycetaceae bacterium]|nr:metallophosphoesterase family protein [Planctomycetaceae bacterium]
MKILLLADIHSNWPALSAIDEVFDVCLFLGDAVDYATTPAECVRWLRDNATYCIRGNHDHSVAQRVAVRPGGTFRSMAAAMRPHHFDVLTDEDLSWLARLPVTLHLNIGNHSFLLVHGTPRDPMDEYLTSDAEQWRQRTEHLDVDFVCVGHTHVPMDLTVGRTRVINPGSVGQPRDGDSRASYAVIEDGNVEFRRVAYDVERTLSHMTGCGIPDTIVRDAETILKAGGNPSGNGIVLNTADNDLPKKTMPTTAE